MTPTDHPLTIFRAAELWDDTPTIGGEWLWHQMDGTMRRRILAAMRAAYDAGREHEREHADPHHDPRPWQDCTREDIREGDLVETCIDGTKVVGIAHHQGRNGDWYTELGYPLTCDDDWPLRRIPAPTPPAEEITLPTEHPAHITDVETASGARCAYMALDRHGDWRGVDQDGDNRHWGYMSIAAFTLPDGTRAHRDGDHEDGTPRFVKAQEGDA